MREAFSVACIVCVILILSMTVLAEDSPTAPTSISKPPVAKRRPVEQAIHGVTIVDPYRWLENGESPETQQFVRDQLAHTRSVLDTLPGRAAIQTRLSQLLTIGTVGTPQVGGEYYFYTRREGRQNQPILYVRKGVAGSDRVLVDVNRLAADGTVALDWWTPSHDGKYVAYGTSLSGSEMSTLHIIETSTGKLLPDTIERTRAASIGWMPDNSGFYYTRYPKKGEVAAGQEMYNRRVFYHALGADPANDSLVFGQGRDPQDWPNVEISEDGRWLVINVQQGWAKTEVYLVDLKSAAKMPIPVVTGKDFIYEAKVFQGELYIRTNEGAPRFRVVTVPAASLSRRIWRGRIWRELVPESDAVISEINIIHGNLVTTEEKEAHSQVRIFELTTGRLMHNVTLPTIGSVLGIGGQWDSDEMFIAFQSFTVPPTIYRQEFVIRHDWEKQKAPKKYFRDVSVWAKVDAPTIDPAKYEVEQVWYASKDGTRVPMFVVAKKGVALDGKNPTLLSGYGGFNVSNTPAFNRGVYVWLERGGVFAVANLRGGAEFGEDWHRAGMLDKKQNVFDDFIGAAEYLISQKYTDKDHLAIQGGSNGGLLVGAALTQRPDLFRAVICQVPLLDMLRYQNFQIAKLWIPEYGSAENPDQFKWLHAYSPYHRVKSGTVYPSVLFMTADTDTRVDPMHAKKMAALLQAEAANGPDRPILLRIEPKAGHGAGKPVSKLIDEGTDMWSFLFWQLGVEP
ncbi:MAG TPA: prolyl oligopeptidase family serine peptidase [Terriglobales bacterium]|nr:prolyl oligopeptidase family serine peptidase [Terriglobales bacterium]